MNLTFQIEEEKRKSHLIGDFAIEASYIKELAPQVFNADGNVLQAPSFQGTCDTLRSLCDQVISSVQTMRDRIPVPMTTSPSSCEDSQIEDSRVDDED
jgi:hypothetical protein